MAIWTVASSGKNGRMEIQSGTSSESLESFSTLDVGASEESPSESSLGTDLDNTSLLAASSEESIQIATEMDPSIQNPRPFPIADLAQSAGVQVRGTGAFVGTSLDLRLPKNRVNAGAKNGATRESEAAVEAALAYLARHQRNNGSWTMRFEESPCRGECDHGTIDALDHHEIAATGLALLCFLGAGHTMHAGTYSEQVNKGVYYLLQSLKIHSASGSWLGRTHNAEMYEHGIATLALCEALQMTGDASLREPCQAAITFIHDAQHREGAWGYHPQADGDLSIAGWQVMALKSAHSAKLSVSPNTVRRVDNFLRRVAADDDFQFVYSPGMKPTSSMTSIGTLIRIYRGVPRSDPSIRKAVEYFARTKPSSTDVYYNYYATQVMFHYGGKPWMNWNESMRDYLVQSQDKQGHTAGSWWFSGISPGSDNVRGGRLYTTAMACLTLEVYYRYMPVYEEIEDEFKF